MNLAALLLVLLTVSYGPGLRPVYARHLRRHALGAEGRAEQLASQLRRAASLAGVELALLAALAVHESAVDHDRTSSAGAVGALQLLPASRWGQGFRLACEKARCSHGKGSRRLEESLNIVWGAYALRDGIRACRGHAGLALGFYRSGRCVEGPRARNTLALARLVRASLTKPPQSYVWNNH
jgi:hypothetical protein